ncbi:MAG: ATP-binding protein [Chryseolinea sp.]
MRALDTINSRKLRADPNRISLMMSKTIKVLLVEDDEDDLILAKEYLSAIETFDFEVDWEPNPTAARSKVQLGDYDVFLIDYHLGLETGLDLIRYIHDKGILTPAIILTGQNNLNVDIDASRSGASDYLVKDELNSSLLERSIRYALSQAKIIRELDEKEKKYRSLFERSMDPIILATKSLGITDVNDSFLRLFGYKLDEIKGIDLINFFAHPEGYESFRAGMTETDRIKDLELTMVTKKGEKKECLLNCVYIPHPTLELCCFQCIVHDLTIRKQAEKDLLMAERLSLTGKLARMIAHEVRNPLTNLNLALDQLRREIPEGSESGQLYSDIIERNSNRIEQLVGEMLRSSRPKELYLELVPVCDLINNTMKLAVDRLKLNQMKFERDCPPDLPQILIDKEKMQIALLNIIINAIEAMEQGKGVLKIKAFQEERILTVSVSDNGKGIAIEDINKLFDPFFTGKQSGMGLGLTSTKNILNSHCAEIDVTSELNKGTTFLLRFTLSE